MKPEEIEKREPRFVNAYPPECINNCFKLVGHSSRILEYLKPDIIFLSGNDVQNYRFQLSNHMCKDKVLLGDKCIFVDCLHYAHRKGDVATETECSVIREEWGLKKISFTEVERELKELSDLSRW